MKPTTSDLEQRAYVDAQIFRMMGRMAKRGVPVEVILDRIGTAMAAHACMRCGSAHTADAFRQMADRIAAGAFEKITGEAMRH